MKLRVLAIYTAAKEMDKMLEYQLSQIATESRVWFN